MVVADVLIGEAEQAAHEIGALAKAVGIDVSQRASIENAAKFVATEIGEIDILVNGAAVFNMAPLAQITEEDFDRQFNINVRGVLFTCQIIADQMIKAGKGRQNHQLLSSQAGRRGEANRRRLLRYQSCSYQS